MWKAVNFVFYGKKITLNQLEEFLNKEKIKDFRIVFSTDKYIEIVYLDPNEE